MQFMCACMWHVWEFGRVPFHSIASGLSKQLKFWSWATDGHDRIKCVNFENVKPRQVRIFHTIRSRSASTWQSTDRQAKWQRRVGSKHNIDTTLTIDYGTINHINHITLNITLNITSHRIHPCYWSKRKRKMANTEFEAAGWSSPCSWCIISRFLSFRESWPSASNSFV